MRKMLSEQPADTGTLENGQWRSFTAGLLTAAVTIFVDGVITLFTSWDALAFWAPPLSNSFISLQGMPFPVSVGLWFGLAVGVVFWMNETRDTA